MAEFDVAGARKEGYDDSQIAEFLAKQKRFNLQGARKEGYSDTDIVGFLTGQKAATAPKPDEGVLTKARGVVEAGGTMLAAPFTSALGATGGFLGGLAGQIRQGELGKPGAAERVMEGAAEGAEKLTPSPQTQTGQAILGKLGDVAEAAKVPPVVPEAMIPAARVAGKGAAATVDAGAAVAKKAAAGAGKVADALTPMPEPRVAALAKRAVDLGIPIAPHQLSKNPVVRMVGEALEKVPLSGSKAKQRQIGFNRSLGTLIGAEESDHLTPDVFAKAMDKSGGKIGEIAKETPIAVDAETQAAFAARLEHVRKFETSDTARIVTSYIKELESKVQGGVLPGEAFRKVNSQIGTQIRGAQGDLRRALSELQEDMNDALAKNIKSPERLAELQQARKQYAIGKTIEPLVAKATTTGDISPARLLGRVTADKAGKARMAAGRGGELGDLAEIGQLFLKEPPSSGTAERAIAYGAIGGAGYIEPHTAAGVYSAANIYNRAGPAVVKRALRNTEAKRSAVPPRRRSEKPKPAERSPYLLREGITGETASADEPLKKAVGE